MAANESPHNKLRRRLWVVTEPYYPEDTSTGYYLTRIAEGLVDDFDVKVICGQPNYSKRGAKAKRREVHQGVEIFRVPGTTLDKNVIYLRVVNMITHGVAVLLAELMKFRSGDLVLVVTTPPSLPFMTAVAALFRGAAYTLLIHDNYPEILIAAGKAKRGSVFVRSIEFLNRWLYKHAAKIIVVGRDMRELLAAKTAGLDVPIATIPNWAELDAVEPLPRGENRTLKDLGIAEKFVFLYAGNMGPPNDLESLVEAADLLRSEDKPHFVFLGAGAKRAWLENQVAARKLTNVTLLAPRPRSEQIEFLNACDVAIVSLVSDMYGVSMPSRTYNALAAGKPILAVAEDQSEIARVVAEDQIGWVVRPGEPAALAECVRQIMVSGEALGSMAKRARLAAIEKYSAETALKRYSEEINGQAQPPNENSSSRKALTNSL